MVSSPEIMKKQAKTHEAKRKRNEKKAASNTHRAQKRVKTVSTTDTPLDNA